MNMKRFTIISLLMCLCTNMFPCAYEVIHNYYMFSAYNKDFGEDADDPLVTFWKDYLGWEADPGGYNYFEPKYKMDEVIEAAGKKHDDEMKAYATQLKRYLDICDEMSETWNYPTREQLQQRSVTLSNIAVAAKAYKGSRLRSRYALLYMRANMVQKKYDVNKTYWTTYASKLEDSQLKDMMEGIYANALLNTGAKKAACEIYAKQGDMQSLAWAVQKYRNLAGIKYIYGQNPNSHTLPFLVEDFVNTYQDVIDSYEFDPGDEKTKADQDKNARDFVDFANSVIKEGKTKSPALWKTAIGVLQFHLGNPRQAEQTLLAAMSMDGTERMKDVARAARAVARSYNVLPNEDFEQFILGELQWLDTKCHDGIKTEYANGTVEYTNHFTRMKDRLFYLCLVPSYEKAGKTTTVLALLDNFCNSSLLPTAELNYSNDFISKLREIPASDIETYYQLIQQGTGSSLERYLTAKLHVNHDFYADMIGTRYLDEANFDMAEPWLKKVHTGFVARLGVASWFGARDYVVEPWFRYQPCSEYVSRRYGENLTFDQHPRLAFCHDMQNLISQYKQAKGEQRCQLAYTLGTRAFQASYMGQCWWLTAYGQSVMDSVQVGRNDIFHRAFDWLQEASKTASTLRLKGKALCALSFMPVDDWVDTDYSYDSKSGEFMLKYSVIPSSARFKNIAAFNDFVNANPGTVMADFASRCDVIKTFRQQTRR